LKTSDLVSARGF